MSHSHNKREANFGLEGWELPVTKTPLEVPQGYFEQLSTDILAAAKAAQSFEDPTLPVSKANMFETPEGYFDTLPDLIMNRVTTADRIIEQGETPWNDEKKINPFSVPESYFETLSTAVTEHIFNSDQDIEAVSPLLASLKKENVYSTPAGYFEQNDLARTSKVNAVPAAVTPKTVEHPSVRTMRLGSWAAAAVVFIILGLGAWQFLGTKGTNTNHAMAANNKVNYSQKLAQVPNQAIQEYINNHLEEFDVNLIENTVSKSGSNISSASALSGFSDEEIEAYLNGDI